jgi:hypothetical protein
MGRGGGGRGVKETSERRTGWWSRAVIAGLISGKEETITMSGCVGDEAESL